MKINNVEHCLYAFSIYKTGLNQIFLFCKIYGLIGLGTFDILSMLMLQNWG